MPEPFKNKFNPPLIRALAMHLQRCANEGEFDSALFIALAERDLHTLELKQRSAQITRALDACLPSDFQRACVVLQQALHPAEHAPLSEQFMDANGVRGWAIMPIADFVALRGLAEFDLAMQMLAQLTKRFTAEFAVRAFIIHDLTRALEHLQAWSRDDNVHVRRLASEGARPRLPWGVQIPALINDPQPLLPILAQLRDDSSDYVRKSVANHLNDIAKDHPQLIVDLAKRWTVDAPPARQRLIRHACRTLVKQGRPDILRVFGLQAAVLEHLEFVLSPQRVSLGDTVGLEVKLASTSAQSQDLLLDYIVHFRLANGRVGKKVFKWKRFLLPAGGTITLRKQHAMRPISTRKFYPGEHRVELQLNGEIVAEQCFELQVPPAAQIDR